MSARRLGPMSSLVCLLFVYLVERLRRSFLMVILRLWRRRDKLWFLLVIVWMWGLIGYLILLLEISSFNEMSSLMSTSLKWIHHYLPLPHYLLLHLLGILCFLRMMNMMVLIHHLLVHSLCPIGTTLLLRRLSQSFTNNKCQSFHSCTFRWSFKVFKCHRVFGVR